MTLYLPTAPFQDKWVYNNDISNKCKFNKHLLNAYYVPEITQDTENIVVNKAKKHPALIGLTLQWESWTINI